MARKPARVGWIEDKRTKVKIPLRLDQGKMLFEAEYGGKTYTSKDGEEVRKQVLAAIREAEALNFHPVIEVKNHAGSWRSVSVELRADITRFYLAANAAGEVYQIKWGNYERGQREPDTRFTIVSAADVAALSASQGDPSVLKESRYSYEQSRLFLPYSVVTWERLTALGNAISKLSGALLDIAASGPEISRVVATIKSIVPPEKWQEPEPEDDDED